MALAEASQLCVCGDTPYSGPGAGTRATAPEPLSAEGEGWGRDRELPQCILAGERGGGCCGKDTHSDLEGVSGDVGV